MDCSKQEYSCIKLLLMSDWQVITSRGGRFLEAPVAGSQQLSNDGMLVILAAGDRTVYEDCSSCFQAMGKTSFFLGMCASLTHMRRMVQLGTGLNRLFGTLNSFYQ